MKRFIIGCSRVPDRDGIDLVFYRADSWLGIEPKELFSIPIEAIRLPIMCGKLFSLAILLSAARGWLLATPAQTRAGPASRGHLQSDRCKYRAFRESPERRPSILFLGDSITYSGQYVDDISMLLRNFTGDGEFEVLNLGLPSETLSGLTEPGHAGGSFPRPNLHDRLGPLLEKTRPDLVIACYGMNDGIYYPFDRAKFEKFQHGIRLLRERVFDLKARLILVTPPVFDPVPIRNKTLPAGLPEYSQPYEGYNEVLDRYAEWLLDQRTNGWVVIDVHFFMKTPTSSSNGSAFRITPSAGDGVHINEHRPPVMAQSIWTA